MTDRLIVRHLGANGHGERFAVTRASDHADSPPVEVQSPIGFPVEGQDQRDLMQELRWYLEGFLDYPFEPWETRAQRLLAARQRWGAAAFDALFHGGLGRDFYIEAVRGGADKLVIEIRSDDPKVLAWPWESLGDTATGVPLAVGCQIERRLTKLAQPPALAGLPPDRLRILLVIARPYEADVGFRSIARPLVEQIEAEQFAAEVTVLRPPTFKRLQEVLEQNPDTFHILHFDGHGGYGSAADGTSTSHQYKGPEGWLVFEDDRGKPAPVEASKLGALLARYKLPAVVLNACQAAMINERAEDPFASVAAALLRGGVRSVVAMAYSLYVSAAQVFLPAFYERLFETGDIGRATQGGRRRMFDQRERVCARGRFPLEDWLIPVLYQQAKLDFGFVQTPAERSQTERAVELPQVATDTENPYGFVGRDSALLDLERAMRRKPAGILVHGLGGVGKTTLARGFVKWLAQTQGLGAGVLWVNFRNVRSAEYVVNEMLGPLAGTNALALPLGTRLDGLTRLLRENPVLVVWDNFESTRGIDGSVVEGALSADDQHTLAKLLEQLRGGRSKILLTSRSEERWLGGPQTCTRVLLGGLTGEERWTFCQVILDDLGLVVDREDADQVVLMNKLGGHPLLMRAVLPKLESMTAWAIAQAVESNLTAVVGEDELGTKVLATLAFVEQSLPEELVPLLVPLGLHEHFVDATDLAAMAAMVPGEWSRDRIDVLLRALSVAGLITKRVADLFEMHPALTTYLRTRMIGDDREEAWQRGFAEEMSKLADAYAPRPLHEQRPVFRVHGANFHRALSLAKMLKMSVSVGALTQWLASYAHNTRDFATAQMLYEELAGYGAREDAEAEATAYHQLGRIALERRDFNAAERWCRKSLSIKETEGNHLGAAVTYRLLSGMALEQRDFDAAERWCGEALDIYKKQGDEDGSAGVYRQLGNVALEQRDSAAAERCYRKALDIFEKQADEHETALTYQLLGNAALQQRDVGTAERWYRKALVIFEKLRNEDGSAGVYHQLGILAHQQQEFETAELRYQKSLGISEKQGNERGSGLTYHQLGRLAEEQGDIETAQRWYRKSLDVSEKQGDEHGAALAYHQLGILAQEQRDFEAAERWYRKALAIREKQGDELEAADTCHGLGMIAQEREDFEAARGYFIRAATTFARGGVPHELSIVAQVVVSCYEVTPEPSKSALRQAWEAAGLEWPAM